MIPTYQFTKNTTNLIYNPACNIHLGNLINKFLSKGILCFYKFYIYLFLYLCKLNKNYHRKCIHSLRYLYTFHLDILKHNSSHLKHYKNIIYYYNSKFKSDLVVESHSEQFLDAPFGDPIHYLQERSHFTH